ncbi:hypothetical protein [Cylindrospermopsis raciborskii]|uniref:hypothetical protein n=1 Tax=Cylindrospermopsis raciborskii TaxID=77022 RepID=UPI000778942A|nr:hypothetical protein [Cylindrospermopsis raciborskii]MCZ2202168.1 hypothetical protein [Cylindrospermopsis raciborskii PAMP2012]MCZ2205292.1 hypothetical protein [Cylindrospermopsis raciborskii PAMP2011]
MSSGSSSPYQSQVFKFFSHQSRRLSQKLGGAFRNLQLATKWGAEALLYPLYNLLQPEKAVGKRLKTSGKNPMYPPLDNHTPMELPIVKVLELVRSLPSAATWESENLQNVKSWGWFGGIVQKLTTGARDDQSLTSKTLQSHIPKIEAIAVNLASRDLVLVGENNKVFDVLTPIQQKQIANSIEEQINNYSNSNMEILADLPPRVFSYSRVLASKCLNFVDAMLVKLEDQAQLPANVTVGSANILVLIQSVIGYIFETRQITLMGEETAPILPHEFTAKSQVGFYPSGEQVQRSHIGEVKEDCWLTWEDLFGSDFSDGDSRQPPQVSSYSKNYQIQESELKLGGEQNKYQFKPDWIEIKAIFIGYEKHPLEQILTWLDHLMLWIEIIFTSIFYFCKGLLQLEQ